jgi:hypothetical protein
MSREDRREQLRRELSTADPPPALLARVEGVAAGWVRVVASGSPEPADDPAVWAITCLVVRREHRRQGVAKGPGRSGGPACRPERCPADRGVPDRHRPAEGHVQRAFCRFDKPFRRTPVHRDGPADRWAGGHDQDRDPAPFPAADLSRSEVGNHPRPSGPEGFRHMALPVDSRIAGWWRGRGAGVRCWVSNYPRSVGQISTGSSWCEAVSGRGSAGGYAGVASLTEKPCREMVQAARRYSWMRPPRMSARSMVLPSSVSTSRQFTGGGAGMSRFRPRCGPVDAGYC